MVTAGRDGGRNAEPGTMDSMCLASLFILVPASCWV